LGATILTNGGQTLDVHGNDVIDWNINANGSVTFDASGFPVADAGFMLAGHEVFAQLIVLSASTANYFYDAAHDVDYTLSVRLKYTSLSITAACQTATFMLPMTTNGTITYNSNMYSGAPFNTTSGAYFEVGTAAIPSLTSGCDSTTKQGVINTHMAGAAAFIFGQSATDPQLLQPQ
jgi:hypothetical protein